MGKNKLARWTELASFDNVIQPSLDDLKSIDQSPGTLIRSSMGDLIVNDHPIKGKWRSSIFRNSNPVILELGCGRGEYTIGLAAKFPEKNVIGIDIKGARMWRGAKTSNEHRMGNVAFLRTRIEFINSFFTADEVDEIWVTFPDPHPGKRNSNKRLTSPWYLNSYRKLLKDKGIIHLKTDNTELYNYTKNVVTGNGLEIILATGDLYSENISDDILSIRTHYENIFLDSGMKINYISFRLNKERNFEYETRKIKS